MMRSLYTGAIGAKIHQTKMDVIGNNISNVNTVGFKTGRATFADMLSQNITASAPASGNVSATNAKQIGLGGSVSAIDTIFTNGAPVATGKNTDMAISGDGLFVVRQGNQTYYTRDGAFEFDADGNYVLPGSGYYAQGWTATDGVIDTAGAVGDIKVAKGQEMAAKGTEFINYYDNLNADVPVVTEINTDTTDPNSVVVTFSDGSSVSAAEGDYKVGNSAPISATAKVYDNLGAVHEIPVYFIREGEVADGVVTSTDKWLVSLSPNASATKGETTSSEFVDVKGNTGTISFNTAEIQFDSSGNLITDGETDTLGAMTFEFDPASFVTETTDDAANADGADAATAAVQTSQNVTLDFSGLTQYAKSTSINTVSDGNTAGILSGVEIDSNGVIIGSYTNGVTRPEAQVALAHFTNAPGLLKNGTSMYMASDNSGVPVIGSADNLGITITPAALEMSNVDVANEFAEMIITQRGFQSNTKIITVSDELIETAVNMKR